MMSLQPYRTIAHRPAPKEPWSRDLWPIVRVLIWINYYLVLVVTSRC